jgi:hypothetical protein
MPFKGIYFLLILGLGEIFKEGILIFVLKDTPKREDGETFQP